MSDGNLVTLLGSITIVVILLVLITIKLSEIHKLIKQYIEREKS